jgi:cobalamin-dependent methionine synthase I
MIAESNEERVLRRARALFDEGAQVIYLAMRRGELTVETTFPAFATVVVSARSLREVEKYLRNGHRS